MHSFNPSMQLRFFHQGRVAVEVHITTPPGRQYTGCYETRRQHQRQRNERWHDMFCITTTTATRRFSVEAKRDDLERSTSVGRILAPWLRQLWNGGDITASAKPSSIIRKSTATVGSSIGGWAAERRDNGESENTNNVERAISDESSDSKFAASDALEFDEHEEEEVHTIIKKGDPKTHWLVDPVLHPHIRACITDGTFESIELAQRDTGLSVCTLGTGAGNATKLRSNTCTVIKRNGDCYLIDAGEGLQRQFLLSRMNFRDVRKILITHLHGDHVFGLPGLLLNLQIAGINATKQRAVEIYGPVGLYNYIATALSLTGTELRRLVVEVYELHGGTQRSMRYAGNRKNFPEFHHRVG